MTVVIGFGDTVEPEIAELDLPPPRIRAYPREAVIAEKFQAMVVLGRANSRMKDFYDIWLLSRVYEFNGGSLARAIATTFVRAAEDASSGNGAGCLDLPSSPIWQSSSNGVPFSRRSTRSLSRWGTW